jgi:hypothetical protein
MYKSREIFEKKTVVIDNVLRICIGMTMNNGKPLELYYARD